MTLTGVQLDSFILNHQLFAEACNRYGIPRYENREPDNNTMALYKGYLASIKTGILLASGYKVGLYAGGAMTCVEANLYKRCMSFAYKALYLPM